MNTFAFLVTAKVEYC